MTTISTEEARRRPCIALLTQVDGEQLPDTTHDRGVLVYVLESIRRSRSQLPEEQRQYLVDLAEGRRPERGRNRVRAALYKELGLTTGQSRPGDGLRPGMIPNSALPVVAVSVAYRRGILLPERLDEQPNEVLPPKQLRIAELRAQGYTVEEIIGQLPPESPEHEVRVAVAGITRRLGDTWGPARVAQLYELGASDFFRSTDPYRRYQESKSE